MRCHREHKSQGTHRRTAGVPSNDVHPDAPLATLRCTSFLPLLHTRDSNRREDEDDQDVPLELPPVPSSPGCDVLGRNAMVGLGLHITPRQDLFRSATKQIGQIDLEREAIQELRDKALLRFEFD
jgi:hypothetical protein